jgi:catechol 2,3-dioxygenase-like lactoylglutathione lyase family enzyme
VPQWSHRVGERPADFYALSFLRHSLSEYRKSPHRSRLTVTHMLGSTRIIAFVSTTDYDKARSFYEGALGLTFVKNDGFAMVLDANGIMIRVVKAPNFKPLPYTILGWEVTNVAHAVTELSKRGVVFERYGVFEQDDLGVWVAPTGDKVAWFKDPDGNTLSVSQHV